MRTLSKLQSNSHYQVKEIQPDRLLKDLAEDVWAQCREKLMEKIRQWKFGGKFLASRYFSGTFQVSNSELLRDTIFKFAAF